MINRGWNPWDQAPLASQPRSGLNGVKKPRHIPPKKGGSQYYTQILGAECLDICNHGNPKDKFRIGDLEYPV